MVYFACRNAATTKLMLTVVGVVSAAVLLLTVLLAGGLATARAVAGQTPRHDLHGTVVVPFGTSAEPVSCGLTFDEALAVLGMEGTAPCPTGPLGRWSDVYAGTPVRVTDGTGDVLGTTELSGGLAEGGTVTFDFTLEDVPEADAYAVEVNARGVVRFAGDRVADDGWAVRVDLR